MNQQKNSMKTTLLKTTVLFAIFLVLLVCGVPFINAHGVGNSIASHNLRVWTNTATKATYKATFLLTNKDDVFLEDADGKVVFIPYTSLSVVDRAIADEHRERIRTYNRSTESPFNSQVANRQAALQAVPEPYFSHETIRNITLALSAVFGGLLCVGIVLLTKHRYPRLKAGILTGVAALSLMAIVIDAFILPTSLIAQTLNVYSKGIAYPTKATDLRSLKFDKKLTLANPTTSTSTSFEFSAVDSMKVLNTSSDPALMDLAFTPYKPAVTTTWDNTYLYVACNGIPAHNMMIGITSWIAQVPIPQPYVSSNTWSIPLNPEYAATPLSIRSNFQKGAIAIAVNGLPIFNALNASGLDSKVKGELDQWGGHCGRADDYHYHVAPLQFETAAGKQPMPIAFALDGYAVYGSKEPDGTTMLALDQYHGHVGSNGVYHYHGTTTSPYMIEAMRGKVTLDPKTTAPENQIIPQAMTKPIRDPFPIKDLDNVTISNLTANAAGNGYTLEYTVGGKKGSIVYSWTGTGFTGLYTFNFIDVDGKSTVQTYQR